MKNVKFIMPFVAVLFAVAGAFAIGNGSKSSFAILDVTANISTCVKDGVCNNNTVTAACQLPSGLQFRIKGETCTAPATGVFSLQ